MKTTGDALTALDAPREDLAPSPNTQPRVEASPATALLLIDGLPAPFTPGESILQVARRAGVRIPTLCDDPRLDAVGSCRLCSVKTDRAPRPVAACTEPALDGMRVVTEDTELIAWRRVILELLLSEHPDGACPRCDEIGPCELHALARAHGATRGRFAGQMHAPAAASLQDDNPFIARDLSRCIACYRCTRMCEQVEQAHAIAPSGRGFDLRIATAHDQPLLESTCTFCGQCVQTCPTGALTDRKRSRTHARAVDVTRVRSICPYCGTGCGIELHVANDRVVGVTPDRRSPVSEGALCVKGQFGVDFVHHRERLTHPQIRRDGELVAVSWGEAYDYIATRFAQIREESGPEAFAFWSSARATNESNYLMQKLARAVVGTNNIDNCART